MQANSTNSSQTNILSLCLYSLMINQISKDIYIHLNSRELKARHVNRRSTTQCNATSRFRYTVSFGINVCDCKYDHITAALHRELHWLPLEHEQRILNYLCPSYNYHLFQSYKPVRSLRSSTMNLLISDTQIKAKILLGDHAFSFCVPKLWNDSPEHIQCKMEFEYSFL